MSDFTVWRHTWRKNWVNCAVLTGNSAGLRTVFPVVFQTENCAFHSGNPTVSSVYLFLSTIVTRTRRHTELTKYWRTWWETCAVPENIRFSFSCSSFTQLKLHSLTWGVWVPYEWILSTAQATNCYLEISSFLAPFSSTGVCCLLLVTALSNYIWYAEVIPNKYILRVWSDYSKQRGRLCRLNHKSLRHQKILILRTKLHPQITAERKMKGTFSYKLNRKETQRLMKVSFSF